MAFLPITPHAALRESYYANVCVTVYTPWFVVNHQIRLITKVMVLEGRGFGKLAFKVLGTGTASFLLCSVYEPESRNSANESCPHFSLSLLCLTTMKESFCYSKALCLWHLVVATQMDSDKKVGIEKPPGPTLFQCDTIFAELISSKTLFSYKVTTWSCGWTWTFGKTPI